MSKCNSLDLFHLLQRNKGYAFLLHAILYAATTSASLLHCLRCIYGQREKSATRISLGYNLESVRDLDTQITCARLNSRLCLFLNSKDH